MGTSTAETAADRRRAILVEFAQLSDEQETFVDLHPLRAVGTTLPRVDTDGVLIEFWLRDGETVDELYDDIRGWAIGHGLPVRGLVD